MPAAAEWTLPRGPHAAAAARRRVGGQLSQWGLRDLVDDGELLVSELVANAVAHTVGPITLRVRRTSGGARCEVADGDPHMGPAFRGGHQGSVGDDDESGRGLFLIAALACAWGIAPRRTGKSVWFDLRGA